MNRKSEVTNSFNRGASKWSDMYDKPTTLFEHCVVDRLNLVSNYIFENIDINSKVLDLGCGTGKLTHTLTKRGMDVTSSDISQNMISLAAKRNASLQDNAAALLQSDCEYLPFKSDIFDLVISLGVISFLETDEKMLHEIARTMKDNGNLILAVRNKKSLTYYSDLIQTLKRGVKLILHKLAKYPIQTDTPIPRKYIINDLVTTLGKNGFVLNKIDYIGYGPLTLNNYEILPHSVNIMISKLLYFIFSKLHLLKLKSFGDISILYLTKQT